MARPASTLAAAAAAALALAVHAAGSTVADAAGAGKEECKVIPGKKGLYVQGVLMAVSITALLVKFSMDKSGRRFGQFIVDSSKQMAGAGWMHALNLLTATVLKLLGIGRSGDIDECSWYWIEIVMDTTIGVWIEYQLLKLIIATLERKGMDKLARDLTAPIAGGKAFSFSNYMKQVVSWMLVVTLMKLVMIVFMLVEEHQMFVLVSFVLSPFKNDPSVKLIAVMIVTPAIMNSVQFWLVDNIFLETTHTSAPKRSKSELSRALLGSDGLEGLTEEEKKKVHEEVHRRMEDLEKKIDLSDRHAVQLEFAKIFEQQVKDKQGSAGLMGDFMNNLLGGSAT